MLFLLALAKKQCTATTFEDSKISSPKIEFSSKLAVCLVEPDLLISLRPRYLTTCLPIAPKSPPNIKQNNKIITSMKTIINSYYLVHHNDNSEAVALHFPATKKSAEGCPLLLFLVLLSI